MGWSGESVGLQKSSLEGLIAAITWQADTFDAIPLGEYSLLLKWVAFVSTYFGQSIRCPFAALGKLDLTLKFVLHFLLSPTFPSAHQPD